MHRISDPPKARTHPGRAQTPICATRPRRSTAAIAALASTLALLACTPPPVAPTPSSSSPPTTSPSPPTQAPIALTYLGVAGWQITSGAHALLVDPYFS